MTNLLRRYRVGTRLSFAFGILLVLLLAIAAVGLTSMSNIQGRLDGVALQQGGVTTATEKLFDYSGQMADLARDAVLAPQAAESAEGELLQLRGMYREARVELEQFATDDRGRELRRQVDLKQAAAAPLIDAVLELVAAGQSADARQLLNEQVLPAINAWRGSLRENLILQTAKNGSDHAAAVAAYGSARAITGALGGLALAIGAALAWLITRSLTGPLQEATRVARDIAQGSLDGVIEPRGQDELATLLQSMKDMQAGLQAFAQ